jgi:hypothetical protein
LEALELQMNEFIGFWFVVIIVVCMAWIWRKLKDIETHLKERDLVQKKHNNTIESFLSSLSQEAVNQEWERKFKAEHDLKKDEEGS